jgi:hypothetical protein
MYLTKIVMPDSISPVGFKNVKILSSVGQTFTIEKGSQCV